MLVMLRIAFGSSSCQGCDLETLSVLLLPILRDTWPCYTCGGMNLVFISTAARGGQTLGVGTLQTLVGSCPLGLIDPRATHGVVGSPSPLAPEWLCLARVE